MYIVHCSSMVCLISFRHPTLPVPIPSKEHISSTSSQSGVITTERYTPTSPRRASDGSVHSRDKLSTFATLGSPRQLVRISIAHNFLMTIKCFSDGQCQLRCWYSTSCSSLGCVMLYPLDVHR